MSWEIGEIYGPCGQAYVEWKIPNYFSLSQRTDTYIKSPTFNFSNATWHLRIYPNGQRSSKSVGWVSLCLILLQRKYIPLTCTMGIKGIKCDSFCEDRVQFWCFTGFSKFIKREELLRNKDRIIDDGELTIFCVSTHEQSVRSVASQTESLYGLNTLSRDLQSLFHSRRKSDVTIKVNSVQFPVHKLILGTRSPVFAAMFEHDMRENASGVVNIEDCDPDTFFDFILFIYTGKMEDLPSKNLSQLFMLSDKYDVSDLREMLMVFMRENLCLDTACQVITIADKHSIEDLRASAKEMIIKNIKKLLPTEQWIMFLKENPKLATDLLMTVIPDSET